MHHLSAHQLSDAFKKGEFSATTIVDHFLSRIRQHDEVLGSFLNLFEDRLHDTAKKLDHKRQMNQPLGKLAGVPIGIKDNIHIKDEITTCGSQFLLNYRALFTATACQRLEDEDALLLGKMNLDEFAMGSSCENSSIKPTRNPWNLDYVPGGSSGGSAAAVAARLCPISLGTDTGGSIRQPASLCGIVGLKPTYGRISRYGLVAFGTSLDQIGPFSTNVADSALALEVMAGRCANDGTSLREKPMNYSQELHGSLKGVKIGVPWHFLENLNDDVKANFEQSIETLKNAGATIVEVNLDKLKYSIAVYYIVATAEASTNLARFDGIRFGVRSNDAKTLDEVYDMSKEDGFGPEVKRRIALGTYVLSSGFKDDFFNKALKVRRIIYNEYQNAFKQCDLIAMPTSPFTAFKIGAIHDPLQMYLADIYTISVNLAGLPGISIPSGFSNDGLPYSLQLIAAQKQEHTLLSAAHGFETITGFTKKMPEMAK
ncbi:MAG: Asp-tRNA(Asn)/Glu-tRNA(Gln) amidotransferase subunit GatA [Parachlamydiales bacterium]|nr:Asp-tRNA(Asn)/Glu-tRNA(Gln) amidotransferase subunit GatA [Parachlamydiales bacterium]